MRPPSHKQIFLSAVSAEFRSYRDLLATDINGPHLDVKVQEDFIVTGGTTLEKLDTYIRGCDAVLHLIGDATGAIPPPAAVEAIRRCYPDLLERLPPLADALEVSPPTVSYTQWEAYLAIYHTIRLHIYQAEPTAPRDATFKPDPLEKALQERHYQRIQDLGRDRGRFTNQERLSSIVLRDLQDILPPRDEVVPAAEKIPAAVQTLLDEAKDLVNKGYLADAKAKCEEALKCAKDLGHRLAEIKASIGLAFTIQRIDPDAARSIFRGCLFQLRTTPSEKLREEILCRLGELESFAGNLLDAKALLTESLGIARRLEGRINIASNLMALAMVARGEGNPREAIGLYDEALTLYMAEFQTGDPKTETESMRGVGACFNNKSLAQKQLSDLVGALSSLEQAVVWFRRADSKDDLMWALFIQAEAKFADAKWDDGAANLQEAQELAIALQDHTAEGQCLDLFGRLNFTFGRRAEALTIFESRLSLMRSKGKPEEIVDVLPKVARLYIANGLKDEARKLLNEAKDLSQQHDMLEDYADSLVDLANLEEGEDAKDARDKAGKEAISVLEKLLFRTENQGYRAFLMGRIGTLYQRLERVEEARNWFHQAKELFERIGDVQGVANCLGAIAEMCHTEEKLGEELDAYREILAIARGKAMHRVVAGAKINMGNCLISYGQFREAKQLFEEAAELCERHHLEDFEEALIRNQERVQFFLDASKPAALDFEQLVGELHELVAFFPEAADSILRFWYYCRDSELAANSRSMSGVKFLIVEDDVGRFVHLSEKLAPYGDLNLQTVNTTFPGGGIDFVPFPPDKPFLPRVSVPVKRTEGGVTFIGFMHGNIRWPYAVTSGMAVSKVTGRTACILTGFAMGLPPQAHALMLEHSVEELIARKLVFYPLQPSVIEERLLNDLRLAKEQSLILIYPNGIPYSGDVDLAGAVPIQFPVVPAASMDQVRRKVSAVKRKLVRALSLGEQDAINALSEVSEELDDISSLVGITESVSFKACVLRFRMLGVTVSHIALVGQKRSEE